MNLGICLDNGKTIKVSTLRCKEYDYDNKKLVERFVTKRDENALFFTVTSINGKYEDLKIESEFTADIDHILKHSKEYPYILEYSRFDSEASFSGPEVFDLDKFLERMESFYDGFNIDDKSYSYVLDKEIHLSSAIESMIDNKVLNVRKDKFLFDFFDCREIFWREYL